MSDKDTGDLRSAVQEVESSSAAAGKEVLSESPPTLATTSKVEKPNDVSKKVFEYKLVMIGAGGVGKSCLLVRFITGNFPKQIDPTVEDSYRHQCVIDEESVVLEILDTGDEPFRAMREQYLRLGEGFLLVYSVTDRSSFEDVDNRHVELLSVKDRSTFPVILVAAKADQAARREVSREEGEQLAQRLKVQYVETSAKDNINVEKTFHDLVRVVRQDKISTPTKKCTIQ